MRYIPGSISVAKNATKGLELTPDQFSRSCSESRWKIGARANRYAVACVSFFFQAEDGIRDYKVTGVQTCALPICADVIACGLRVVLKLPSFWPRSIRLSTSLAKSLKPWVIRTSALSPRTRRPSNIDRKSVV